MSHHSSIELTQKEIGEDYKTLTYLVEDYQGKINLAYKNIYKFQKRFSLKAYEQAIIYLQSVIASLESLHQQISHTQAVFTYPQYITHYEQLRSLLPIIASAITSLDSQSPSFFSSTHSLAGRFTNQIIQSFNDYGRDQHGSGREYEKLFIKEYIDAPLKYPFHAYTTTSGMAALTTIIGFILESTQSTRPIIVGKSCYFEEKSLLKTFFSDRIIEVDEDNIRNFLKIIKENNPGAIFIDSLSNSSTLLQPDIFTLMSEFKKESKDKCYLVIDNTALSVTFQPFSRQFFSTKNMQIIVWESLIKHAQFGFDKVNGGIIYTNISNGIELYAYRDHLGTNLGDIQALMIPSPNRNFLEKRIYRHERNATLIIENIQTTLEKKSSKIETVLSPTLSAHPSFQSAHQKPFHGAFITLRFQTKYSTLSTYKAYMKKVFSLATERNVSIVGGTSFGFCTTRIYIPASRPGQGIPFVRIAVGTEPYDEIMKVASVFSDAL